MRNILRILFYWRNLFLNCTPWLGKIEFKFFIKEPTKIIVKWIRWNVHFHSEGWWFNSFWNELNIFFSLPYFYHFLNDYISFWFLLLESMAAFSPSIYSPFPTPRGLIFFLYDYWCSLIKSIPLIATTFLGNKRTFIKKEILKSVDHSDHWYWKYMFCPDFNRQQSGLCICGMLISAW